MHLLTAQRNCISVLSEKVYMNVFKSDFGITITLNVIVAGHASMYICHSAEKHIYMKMYMKKNMKA